MTGSGIMTCLLFACALGGGDRVLAAECMELVLHRGSGFELACAEDGGGRVRAEVGKTGLLRVQCAGTAPVELTTKSGRVSGACIQLQMDKEAQAGTLGGFLAELAHLRFLLQAGFLGLLLAYLVGGWLLHRRSLGPNSPRSPHVEDKARAIDAHASPGASPPPAPPLPPDLLRRPLKEATTPVTTPPRPGGDQLHQALLAEIRSRTPMAH